MKLKCDKCNKEFVIESEDIIETELNIDGKDISLKYFECSHCKYKYINSCIDDYIRKEQRRYQKLIKSIDEVDKTQKCLRNMKLHSDRLKAKIIDKL